MDGAIPPDGARDLEIQGQEGSHQAREDALARLSHHMLHARDHRLQGVAVRFSAEVKRRGSGGEWRSRCRQSGGVCE